MEKLQEYCSNCCQEVTIDAEFKMQVCPNCGKVILPCSMCDMDSVDCNKCKLKQHDTAVNEQNDIMDTYNSHNAELVRKINAAWKSDRYHRLFDWVLYSLLMRDYNEYEATFGKIPKDADTDYAMEHAHEIMEGVCDDTDLQTILLFIRYDYL